MTLIETIVTLLIMTIMIGMTILGISVASKETAKSYADKIATYINSTLNQSLNEARDFSAHGVLRCTGDKVSFIIYGSETTENDIQTHKSVGSAEYLSLETKIKTTQTNERTVNLRSVTCEELFGKTVAELKTRVGTVFCANKLWHYTHDATCFVSEDGENAYEFTDDGLSLYFDYSRCIYTGPSEITVRYKGEEAHVTINEFGKAKAEK